MGADRLWPGVEMTAPMGHIDCLQLRYCRVGVAYRADVRRKGSNRYPVGGNYSELANNLHCVRLAGARSKIVLGN